MKRLMILMILVSLMLAGCKPKIIGGETDEHGCLIAAGYSWCEAKQKCLRTWEEPCELVNLEEKAMEFCGDKNIAKIYTCGDYIKVVSRLTGRGVGVYRADGSELNCPIVSPAAMTEECLEVMVEPTCEEKEIVC